MTISATTKRAKGVKKVYVRKNVRHCQFLDINGAILHPTSRFVRVETAYSTDGRNSQVVFERVRRQALFPRRWRAHISLRTQTLQTNYHYHRHRRRPPLTLCTVSATTKYSDTTSLPLLLLLLLHRRRQPWVGTMSASAM